MSEANIKQILENALKEAGINVESIERMPNGMNVSKEPATTADEAMDVFIGGFDDVLEAYADYVDQMPHVSRFDFPRAYGTVRALLDGLEAWIECMRTAPYLSQRAIDHLNEKLAACSKLRGNIELLKQKRIEAGTDKCEWQPPSSGLEESITR